MGLGVGLGMRVRGGVRGAVRVTGKVRGGVRVSCFESWYIDVNFNGAFSLCVFNTTVLLNPGY